jgi:metal-responsive CopG/Arc/MetJ family transcriptional regulator
MAKSIVVKPKKRGRPATGRDPVVGVRISPEVTTQLDLWAKANSISSRSEAIRRIIEQALGTWKKKAR